MASSTTIDVDSFGSDIKEEGMESLDFQDIPHDSPDSPEKGQTTHFTRFPHSAADSDEEEVDQDKEKLIKEEKSGTSSFWTFAYYQQFFDVETAQVGQRMLGSMVPRPGSNYLVHQIRPNPDLYGPFWICTTLVFTTAIAGNLANYFSMAGKSYHWQYDFHKVTFAATAIFSYWWLVPLLLWGVLWWRSSQARFSFLEMLCVYGYSLAIYVPISILWAIQVSWLQWTLVLVGAALSGSVLLLTFWPAIKEDSQKIAIGLMVFIFVMHAALAAGFLLYFFHVPTAASPAGPATVAPVPVPVNKTMGRPDSPPQAAAVTGGIPGDSGIGNNQGQPLQQKTPDSAGGGASGGVGVVPQSQASAPGGVSGADVVAGGGEAAAADPAARDVNARDSLPGGMSPQAGQGQGSLMSGQTGNVGGIPPGQALAGRQPNSQQVNLGGQNQQLVKNLNGAVDTQPAAVNPVALGGGVQGRQALPEGKLGTYQDQAVPRGTQKKRSSGQKRSSRRLARAA